MTSQLRRGSAASTHACVRCGWPQGAWTKIELEENKCMVFPMTKDFQDSFTLGAAVDVSNALVSEASQASRELSHARTLVGRCRPSTRTAAWAHRR